MIKNKTISLCLPCRNEGAHLKELISSVPRYIDEIVIISNASTDNTVAIAKKIGGRVKVVEDNRVTGGIGYGFAHMSGIAAANGDFIVGADGDGTYPIKDIDKVIIYMMTNHLDFVSCSRYPLHDNTKIPIKLQVGVKLLNWEVKLFYGLKINDILSGMWTFKKEFKGGLNLTMGDWNLSPQIKINAATDSQIKFAEYPIVQHVRMGDTKQSYLKTGFSHVCWLMKNRFSPR